MRFYLKPHMVNALQGIVSFFVQELGRGSLNNYLGSAFPSIRFVDKYVHMMFLSGVSIILFLRAKGMLLQRTMARLSMEHRKISRVFKRMSRRKELPD